MGTDPSNERPTNEQLYNVRAAVPDHLQVFERWAAQSAVVRKRYKNVSHLDLAYGRAPLARLDLFCTDQSRAFQKKPLLIFLHGGYWQAMDKSFFSFLAPPFLEAGISLANVNYSLCPEVSLGEIVSEIEGALLWLSQRGEQYGYDGDRLHLSGHSAGGHLTAMMMVSADCAPLLASGLSLSGLFDLQPLVDTSINEKLALDQQAATNNSPAFKNPRTKAPLVLAVGEFESQGFHDQSDLLAQKWRGDLSQIKRMNLTGCNHLTALDQWTDPRSAFFRAACSLIVNQA